MLDKKNHIRPNIEGEMDEFQRLSQDLKRDDNIDVSVDEIVKAFKESKERTLTNDVWVNLENTESNQIEKGDWDSVKDIARTYKKTNPKKLKDSLERGDYSRPLIVKLGERYILVAGNTRLSTAAAMGINPKVFIGKLKEMNESNELKGGIADNKSLVQIAKKHDAKGYYHIDNMVSSLKKQLNMGMKVEMEHTDDKSKAKEIALDHLWEDPNYYSKLKKIEATESTDSGSSGAFTGSAFGGTILKRDIHKIHNSKLHEVADVSGFEFDVPFGGDTPKGKKDPLKISGPDSTYKGRAVKDKKFPRYGGPNAVFVKIKEKCKKFPYCNQGNTGAIEFIKEDSEIQTAINEVSKNTGIPKNEIQKIVFNEIKQIFISNEN